MRRLLLGLMLAVAPAACTMLPPSTNLLYYPIQFDTYVTPVTTVDTPEWARLTDVFAWWELQLGSFESGGSPITVYLRAVLKQAPAGFTVVQWLEFVPVTFELSSPGEETSTPEPGTIYLVAGGLAMAAFGNVRRRGTP